MYSMPQQAVTNGYWKNDQRRPQLTTSCTVSLLFKSLRKNPSAALTVVVAASAPSNFSSAISFGTVASFSLPVQRAFLPNVDQAEGEDRREADHRPEPQPAGLPEGDRPREEEHG